MENFYFTIFSVESLIPVGALLVNSFFFLRIKGRSSATTHLGLMMLLYSSIPICYFITSIYYHPLSAYVRWVGAYTSLPTILHVILFFLNYPEEVNRKLNRSILIGGYAAILIGWIVFIFATRDALPVYQFSGHYWDMDADTAQRRIAAVILLAVIVFIGVAVWRVVTTPGRERWIILALLGAFLVVSVGPAIANLKSRQGVIGRGVFMTILDLTLVLGIFLLVTIYINNTRDRTSFMAKILGITLVTFFLVLEFLSAISLSDRDESFDREMVRDANLILSNVSVNDNLKYVQVYNAKKDILLNYDGEKISGIDFNSLRGEMLNTFILTDILSRNIGSRAERRSAVQGSSQKYGGKYFRPYSELITAFTDSLPENSGDIGPLFVDFLNNLDKSLVPLRIRILKIAAPDFLKDLRKETESWPENLRPFAAAIQEDLNNFPADYQDARAEALTYLAPMKLQGSRFFRADRTGHRHYISYMFVDLKQGLVSETGFDYLVYRQYMHPPALKFVIMFLTVLLFIVIGFPVFFLGALMKPLNALLGGLRQVGQGSIDINLRVFVEDEIGFITRSFNSMVRAIKTAELKLQRYAAGLEKKVKARTAELSKTLEAVQLLKNQQDGDYFLTSLILKPLGSNRAKSETVKIEFLLDQKKKFKFRRWESDLGGDICITDNIKLGGDSFTAFINGDAMGKSIQGATGAMVLGAAIQSILERNKTPLDQKQTPERWLKNAFSEMHAIFQTFDGSMLMSAVFGLIEEKTGFMYFINAEHPWTVMFRDGEASFIEKDGLFRKLGSALLAGRVTVQTRQLMPGDVILVGSDGRDDLLIGMDEKGSRIINEDETLFLRAVEEGRGSLKGIFDSIVRRGELTDDFSLMRIEYLNPEKSGAPDPLLAEYLSQARAARKNKKLDEAVTILEKARVEKKEHPLLSRELFNNLLLQKDYIAAVAHGQVYSRVNPSDTATMFALSYSLKKIGEYEKGAELGERVRLRDEKNINNLINLAECCYLSGDFSRSKKIAGEILELDSSNNRAKTIIKKIQARS